MLGFILKRTLIRPETQWHGLERLTYYVLLPLFLIQTLVKADLSTVPVGGVGRCAAAIGARGIAGLSRAAPCSRAPPVDGPAFTSIFQGATRWQTYVALSVSGSLFGNLGLAIGIGCDDRHRPAGQRAQRHQCWPTTPRRKSVRPASIVVTVASNPLIWACVIGLALNVTHRSAAEALARGGGRARPFLARHRPAGDRRRPASRRPVQASLAAGVAVFLKLVLMPAIAVALAVQFGITGSNLAVVTILFGGAHGIERLCAGAADGRRRAAIGADHHAADHFGGADDADRDCAGAAMCAAGLAVPPALTRPSIFQRTYYYIYPVALVPPPRETAVCTSSFNTPASQKV